MKIGKSAKKQRKLESKQARKLLKAEDEKMVEHVEDTQAISEEAIDNEKKQRKREKNRRQRARKHAKKLLEAKKEETRSDEGDDPANSEISEQAGKVQGAGTKKRKAASFSESVDSAVEPGLETSGRPSKKQKSMPALQTKLVAGSRFIPKHLTKKERRRQDEKKRTPKSPIRVYIGPNDALYAAFIGKYEESRGKYGSDNDPTSRMKIYHYQGFGETDKAGIPAMKARIKKHLREWCAKSTYYYHICLDFPHTCQ